MKKRRQDSTAPLCLHVKRPGLPELIYWPKLGVMTAEGKVTPDALLYANEHGRTLWAIVEIDENGTPTQESLRRERLLPVPTIRVSGKELCRMDFMDRLIDRVRQLLEAAA